MKQIHRLDLMLVNKIAICNESMYCFDLYNNISIANFQPIIYLIYFIDESGNYSASSPKKVFSITNKSV